MKRRLVLVSLSLALLGALPAAAGPATDVLSQCLVGKTTGDDQVTFMRWMFSSMALHPRMSELANIDTAKRAEIDQQTGAVFERLLTVDCRAEVIASIKEDGGAGLGQAFNTLGQAAAVSLLGAPEVAAGMQAAGMAMDEQKLNELQAEAMK